MTAMRRPAPRMHLPPIRAAAELSQLLMSEGAKRVAEAQHRPGALNPSVELKTKRSAVFTPAMTGAVATAGQP